MTNQTGVYFIIFYAVFAAMALLLIVAFIVNVIEVIIARRQDSKNDNLDEIE